MILMVVPMAWHDQKYVTSHFDHLDWTNGILSQMMHLASCDTDTSINGITWPKIYVAHCFNFLDLMNTVVLLTMVLSSHDDDDSAINVKLLEKSYCISFWSSWTKKYNGTIDDAISVMWFQHWYHMNKKHLATCLNHLDLANKGCY